MTKQEITKENIETIVSKWQKILRLQDWDISVQIVENEWRKSGDVKIDIDNKMAILLINKNPKCENLVELVIHELLHIRLWPMDQMIEELLDIVYGKENSKQKDFGVSQFMGTLESTVQDLTKGYVELSNSGPLSFGRLRKEVQVETEK